MVATAESSAITINADVSFLFVQALAEELSAGKVELAGFPEIVARVQRTLSDENVSTEKVVQVLGAEPVLAAQLLTIANSVAMNPSGRAITDLRSAVARVGLNTVRSATLSFAVRQLRAAEEIRPIAKQLEQLWQRNVLIGSLSYVIARRRTRVNADTALLTGLLQGVGRLYIITRAVRHPALFANLSTYQLIERDWHLSIATALLENWGIPPEIISAVRDSEDYGREPRGDASLTDVLVAANILAIHAEQPEFLDVRLQTVRAISKLGLTREISETLVKESAEEIAALREALG